MKRGGPRYEHDEISAALVRHFGKCQLQEERGSNEHMPGHSVDCDGHLLAMTFKMVVFSGWGHTGVASRPRSPEASLSIKTALSFNKRTRWHCAPQDCVNFDYVIISIYAHLCDPQDWMIPLGNSFRSLKLWCVLRTYGACALREYIRHHLALAEVLAQLVEADSRFELAAPPMFALVCFSLKASHISTRVLRPQVKPRYKVRALHCMCAALATHLCLSQ
jgi:Pyridoxal-dependent decarboxylase conserved domain